MSRSNVVNFHTLCQEKQTTEEILRKVKIGFPGFETPELVLKKYKDALEYFKRLRSDSCKRPHGGIIRRAVYLFMDVRNLLTRVLTAFFKNCKVHFYARLQSIKASEELCEMRHAVQYAIGDLAAYSRSRYIKIDVAAQRYLTVHGQIEALALEQARITALNYA